MHSLSSRTLLWDLGDECAVYGIVSWDYKGKWCGLPGGSSSDECGYGAERTSFLYSHTCIHFLNCRKISRVKPLNSDSEEMPRFFYPVCLCLHCVFVCLPRISHVIWQIQIHLNRSTKTKIPCLPPYPESTVHTLWGYGYAAVTVPLVLKSHGALTHRCVY